ncbi:MAG: N-acetylmuramoyl-L-alanine amidase [Saprospiraceae bacterium]|nr:N-acetylmuramoyl-L-alanine amidase [Saprospiraceae bacterium]
MKNFFQAIADFFSSLFGKKTAPAPAPSPVPTKKADPNDRLPGEVEDSSDVPVDTVKTLPVIAVIPDAPGPFADEDKEDAVDSEEPGPSTPTTGSGGTTTTPTTGGGGSTTTTPTTGGGGSTTTTPTTGGGGTTPSTPAHRFLWCLDNGHGKLQPGKRSPLFDDGKTRFMEYEFNRDVVERIMKGLDKHGVKYYDVVPDFNEVGSFLKERVDRANKKKSDLTKIYVSVHSNAGPAAENEWIGDNVKGIETWYAENSTRGKKLAAVFQKHLILKTGMKNRNLKSTAITSLYVLEKTTMPALLTENGFYNNKLEVKELMKDSVRQKIAEAHVEAILEIEKNGIV